MQTPSAQFLPTPEEFKTSLYQNMMEKNSHGLFGPKLQTNFYAPFISGTAVFLLNK